MRIDAHHHLWDLQAIHYPWLMAKGEKRFFGDPSSIQRNYLLEEYSNEARLQGFGGSVHIQVGAKNAWEEAVWIDHISKQYSAWPLVQVAFCDLTAKDREAQLDKLQTLSSVRGIRQIIGRAPGEDAANGTNELLSNPEFKKGLASLARRNLGFDLQLLPELMKETATLLSEVPQLKVALCHAGSPYNRSQSGIEYWGEQLQSLASLPLVFCKLSGLGMFKHDWTIEDFRPLVNICIKQFGQDRCMFGSNFPVDSLSSDYPTLVQAFHEIIPVADHNSILGGTAEHFYCF